LYNLVPAIEYRQGERTMYTLAMDAGTVMQMVAKPERWDPVAGPMRGNRPQDPKHRAGIAEYVENERNPILGAAVLYIEPSDVAGFDPFDGQEKLPIRAGMLQLRSRARVYVGDGQHRIGGLSDAVAGRDDDDPVGMRVIDLGLPVILVVDDDQARMAQDFTDLQRNAKPPTTSLGTSMDRRQPVNRFTLDVVTNPDLALLYNRVEFQKDSPGKLSAKAMSFKVVRYVIGTLLIGVSQRTTKGWEAAVNQAVGDDGALEGMTEFFRALSEVDPWSRIVAGEGEDTPEHSTVASVRATTFALSASVLYAIAYAAHRAVDDDDMTYAEAAHALAGINFDRPTKVPTPEDPWTSADSIFVGSIIEATSGKMLAGREAWETAADVIYNHIRSRARQASAA